MNPQVQARQKPGLQAGEGWFDVCAEGSRPAGPRSSQDPRHSEFSACLGEAMYSATAQALAFLCAVAPQASTPAIAAVHAALHHCALRAHCQDRGTHGLGPARIQLVIFCAIWYMRIENSQTVLCPVV